MGNCDALKIPHARAYSQRHVGSRVNKKENIKISLTTDHVGVDNFEKKN